MEVDLFETSKPNSISFQNETPETKITLQRRSHAQADRTQAMEAARAAKMKNRRRAEMTTDGAHKMNTNLMTAKIMTSRSRVGSLKKTRQFESARSRRGSEYVDDFNLNDTLFFDGAEEVECQ